MLVGLLSDAKERPLDDALRSELARRAAGLSFRQITPLVTSLERDPDDPAAFYVAADSARPLLLRCSGSTVTAIPFASGDYENIQDFCQRIAPKFLPRPQGALPAIAVGNRHPEISLPAAFEAFRQILTKTGANLASTVQLSERGR